MRCLHGYVNVVSLFFLKYLPELLSAPFLLWWREILQSRGWLQETETTKGLTVVKKVSHLNFLMILKARNLLHKKWEQESEQTIERICTLHTWTGERACQHLNFTSPVHAVTHFPRNSHINININIYGIFGIFDFGHGSYFFVVPKDP